MVKWRYSGNGKRKRMVFVDSLKLELPDLFPAEQYSEFMSCARSALLGNKGEAWTEFAGASNLIGWRFRAAFEYMRAYSDSWKANGADVSFDEIFVRD